jgi:hypothetical protein
MKPRPRKTANLSESAHQQLKMYAFAATAAGVGVLALAKPAQGKIIYTSPPCRHIESPLQAGSQSRCLQQLHRSKNSLLMDRCNAARLEISGALGKQSACDPIPQKRLFDSPQHTLTRWRGVGLHLCPERDHTGNKPLSPHLVDLTLEVIDIIVGKVRESSLL